jgi:hypothetical protein
MLTISINLGRGKHTIEYVEKVAALREAGFFGRRREEQTSPKK